MKNKNEIKIDIRMKFLKDKTIRNFVSIRKNANIVRWVSHAIQINKRRDNTSLATQNW